SNALLNSSSSFYFKNITAELTTSDQGFISSLVSLKVYVQSNWSALNISKKCAKSLSQTETNYAVTTLNGVNYSVCYNDTDGDGIKDYFKVRMSKLFASGFLIDARDLDAPSITNVSIPNATYVNRYITISARVTDNINVSRVWAIINTPGASANTASMILLSNSTYRALYRAQATGVYNITIYANDTLGGMTRSVYAGSLTSSLEVVNISTYNRTLALKNEFELGETVRIRVNISDPLSGSNITGINLTLWNNNSVPIVVNASMKRKVSSAAYPIYEYNFSSMSFALASIGGWRMKIVATESKGTIINRSAGFRVNDTQFPVITNIIVLPALLDVNSLVRINATIVDLVDSAWAYVMKPNGESQNITLTKVVNISTNFNYRGNYTPPLGGKYNVTIYARDKANHTANSSLYGFETFATTTGRFNLSTRSVVVQNSTIQKTTTFTVNYTFANTGNATAQGTSINITLPANWTKTVLANNCDDVLKTKNCTARLRVTIPGGYAEGYYTLTSNVTWTNPDMTRGMRWNRTMVNITANPYIKLSKSFMYRFIQHGTPSPTERIGKVDIMSIGNKPISGVNISYVSGNLSKTWLSFKPNLTKTPGTINPHTNISLLVNISIPVDLAQGFYESIFIINATGTTCRSPSKCYAYFIINMTNGIAMTTGSLVNNPAFTTVDIDSHFNLTVTLRNTGLVDMSNANITVFGLDTGFVVDQAKHSCGTVTANSSCNHTFIINVTEIATQYTHHINTSGAWINPNSTPSVEYNVTEVYVNPPSERLVIIESAVHKTLNQGTSSNVANFTIQVAGSGAKQLAGITMRIVNDTNALYNFSSHAVFNPAAIAGLTPPTSSQVKLNISVPLGQTPGTYRSYVLANATGSLADCNPDDDCWDYMLLNVTVPVNTSWRITPAKRTVIVPVSTTNRFNITIINDGNVLKNYSVQLAGASGTNIAVLGAFTSEVSLGKRSSATLNFTYYANQTGNASFRMRILRNDNPSDMRYSVINITVAQRPPDIMNVSSLYVKVEYNISNVTLSAYVSDNEEVSKVWANITLPNGSVRVYYMTLSSGDTKAGGTWVKKYRPPRVGIYTFVILANDTTNFASSTNSSSFEVVNTTTLAIGQLPGGVSIYNLSTTTAKTLSLNFSVENTGYAVAYRSNVSQTLPSGWSSINAKNYSYLTGGRSTARANVFGNISSVNKIMNFNNRTTKYNNSFTITIPKGTRSGVYQIPVRASWIDAKNYYFNKRNVASSTLRTINVSVVPFNRISAQPSVLLITAEKGKTTSTIINLTSSGNTDLYSLKLRCNGTVCSQYPFVFNVSTLTLLLNKTKRINLSITIPSNASTGTHRFTVIVNNTNYTKIIQSELRVNIDTHWTRTPVLVNVSVAVNSTGTLALLLVNNTGTIAQNFSLLNIQDATFTNTGTIRVVNASGKDIFGGGSSYGINITKGTSRMFTLQYNATALGVFKERVMINSTSDPIGIPSRLNTTLYVRVIPYSFTVISPTTASKRYNVSENVTLAIITSALYNGTSISGNITWSVRVNNTLCPLNRTYYNATSSRWSLVCRAPFLEAGYKNLSVTGIYRQATLTKTQGAALFYKDLQAPMFRVLNTPSVDFGGKVMLSANITDFSNVSNVTAAIAGPSYRRNFSLRYNTSARLWNMSLANLSVGDYDVTVYATDALGNKGNATQWFEVRSLVKHNFSGNFTNPLNVSQEAEIIFTRPLHSHNVIRETNNTGQIRGRYNISLHERHYDIHVQFKNNSVVLRNVYLNRSITDRITVYWFNASRIVNTLIQNADVRPGPFVSIYFSKNISTNGTVLTLNYSAAFAGQGITDEEHIGIYRCTNWTFTAQNNGSCRNSSWVRQSGAVVNTSQHSITLTLSDLSPYIAAKFICGDNTCESAFGETNALCSADCEPVDNGEEQQPVPPPSAGGGGGGGASRTCSLVCGEGEVLDFIRCVCVKVAGEE
ncbi:hypothetical protein COY95_00115, partial [Candidatus Woesearchaeota archaeon CG_4_10_14_0_8_um_filter_47_5]